MRQPLSTPHLPADLLSDSGVECQGSLHSKLSSINSNLKKYYVDYFYISLTLSHILIFHLPSPPCYCSVSFLSFQLNPSHWRNSGILRAKQHPPLVLIQKPLKTILRSSHWDFSVAREPRGRSSQVLQGSEQVGCSSSVSSTTAASAVIHWGPQQLPTLIAKEAFSVQQTKVRFHLCSACTHEKNKTLTASHFKKQCMNQ